MFFYFCLSKWVFYLLHQFLNLVDNAKNYALFLHCTVKSQCNQEPYLCIDVLDELASIYSEFFSKIHDTLSFISTSIIESHDLKEL